MWLYYDWVTGGDTHNGLNLLDVFYLSFYVAACILTKGVILWYVY